MFAFPALFMLVSGPFFMLGFVPLMRGMTRQMVPHAKGVIAIGLISYVVANLLLTGPVNQPGPTNFKKMLNSLTGTMQPAIAAFIATALGVLIPIVVAWLVMEVVGGLSLRRRQGRELLPQESDSGDSSESSGQE